MFCKINHISFRKEIKQAAFLILLSILLGRLTAANSVQAAWNLTFSDEFNDGFLDTNKWYTLTAWGNRQHGNPGAQELQAYVASGEAGVTSPFSFVTDSNGSYLRIATRRNSSALPASPNGDNYSGANTPAYTSDIINTCFYDAAHPGQDCAAPHSFTQLGGYFEMRARLASGGQGMGPAFWTYRPLPFNSSDPKEIDIMEYLGQNPNQYYVSYHPTGINGSVVNPNVGNLSAGFHTYAVDWDGTTGNLIYYFDGVQVATSSGQNTMPMFVMANLAISSGSWGAAPNRSTVFPSNMDIDYIRVYQKSDTGDYATIPGPTPIPVIHGTTDTTPPVTTASPAGGNLPLSSDYNA